MKEDIDLFYLNLIQMFITNVRSIQSTHASTHSQYSMDVLDVFCLDKDGEKDRFKDLGNKQLLYHGSRLANWAGSAQEYSRYKNHGLNIEPCCQGFWARACA